MPITLHHRRAATTSDIPAVADDHEWQQATTTRTTTNKKKRSKSIEFAKQALSQITNHIRSWREPREAVVTSTSVPNEMRALKGPLDKSIRDCLEEWDVNDHLEWARLWSIILGDSILAGALHELPKAAPRRYTECLKLAYKRSAIFKQCPDVVVDMISHSLVDLYVDYLCAPDNSMLIPEDQELIRGDKQVFELIRWQLVGSVRRAEDLPCLHPVRMRIFSLSEGLFRMFESTC